ncbi:hypothetical protein, partial [Mycobacterium tuberculosis]
ALQRVEHRAQSQQWATEKGDS